MIGWNATIARVIGSTQLWQPVKEQRQHQRPEH